MLYNRIMVIAKNQGDDPMELMEAIYNRRSVRFYTEEPVDKDTIEKLI